MAKRRAPNDEPEDPRKPRILVFDIETAPIKAHVWKIWEENVSLNQIISEWFILSWSAKWFDEPKLLYQDQRNEKDIENDKPILEGLWDLLNEADVVITQNGKNFDSKKVNARFALHGMKPPSPYKHIDTLQLVKKHFAFTSNKLEYLSEKICKKFKKRKSRRFQGFELWLGCLAGNKKAWREMELYNKADVLATEELYKKLSPWGTGIDLNVFRPAIRFLCQCGSNRLQRRGFNYSSAGKFQKFQCVDCGAWTSERGANNNLLSQKKLRSLRGRS